MMFLGSPIEKESLSLLSNPFLADCITDVDLHWYKRDGFGSTSVTIYATVSFKNGNTKGQQKIEAQSMGELIIAVEAFIKTLVKK